MGVIGPADLAACTQNYVVQNSTNPRLLLKCSHKLTNRTHAEHGPLHCEHIIVNHKNRNRTWSHQIHNTNHHTHANATGINTAKTRCNHRQQTLTCNNGTDNDNHNKQRKNKPHSRNTHVIQQSYSQQIAPTDSYRTHVCYSKPLVVLN